MPSDHINRFIIHGIRAYDLIGSGKGGIARIERGGVGQDNVKIYLSTVDRNKDLHFRIQIFGHKLNN